LPMTELPIPLGRRVGPSNHFHEESRSATSRRTSGSTSGSTPGGTSGTLAKEARRLDCAVKILLLGKFQAIQMRSLFGNNNPCLNCDYPPYLRFRSGDPT